MNSGSITLMTQGTRQALFITLQRGFACGVAGVRAHNNFRGIDGLAGEAKIIGRHTGPGEPGFDATRLAAITTRRLREFFGARKRQGIVPPLAGNGVDAGQRFAVDDDAAADAGAENDPEYRARPGRRAIGGFG